MIAMPLLPDPFSEFWKLYSEHCPRMDKKSKCEKKFNQYPIETQRAIYKDIKTRLKHYDDWKEVNERGKRKFMRGPYVYLNAEMWECPIDVKGERQGYVRDTTNEQIRPSQELLGLKKTRDLYLSQGLDTAAIDKQIEKLNGQR